MALVTRYTPQPWFPRGRQSGDVGPDQIAVHKIPGLIEAHALAMVARDHIPLVPHAADRVSAGVHNHARPRVLDGHLADDIRADQIVLDTVAIAGTQHDPAKKITGEDIARLAIARTADLVAAAVRGNSVIPIGRSTGAADVRPNQVAIDLIVPVPEQHARVGIARNHVPGAGRRAADRPASPAGPRSQTARPPDRNARERPPGNSDATGRVGGSPLHFFLLAHGMVVFVEQQAFRAIVTLVVGHEQVRTIADEDPCFVVRSQLAVALGHMVVVTTSGPKAWISPRG